MKPLLEIYRELEAIEGDLRNEKLTGKELEELIEELDKTNERLLPHIRNENLTPFEKERNKVIRVALVEDVPNGQRSNPFELTTYKDYSVGYYIQMLNDEVGNVENTFAWYIDTKTNQELNER